MRPLESLPPDQRAVVALVLQQGRSYDEIAALLGIPVDAVRARAHAGLAGLAPGNGLPAEVTAPLADFLLGQQPDADAEATRGLLAESGPARAWASDVAGRLADVAPGSLPAIPDGDAPATAPDPAPRPAAPAPSSKLGGALLIAAVVAVVAVVLVLVLSGGGDPEEEPDPRAAATATATPTPSATAEARVTDEIALRPVGGGRARGTMTVFLQDGRLLFALQGERLPPSSARATYAVWLTGPGDRARRLGFTEPVGEDGALGIQGPSEKDLAAFPRLYATYENVVVSRERSEDAKRPARIVLSGKLPAGRDR